MDKQTEDLLKKLKKLSIGKKIAIGVVVLALIAGYLWMQNKGIIGNGTSDPTDTAEYVTEVDTTGETEEPTDGPTSGSETRAPPETEPEKKLDVNGSYTTKEDVALYLHTYKKLPKNFITKSEAEKLGWVSTKGNLWKVTDHKSIGGDTFGNREGLLPDGKWVECDINYNGGTRGSERLVFSKDCSQIYYTGDHYETFERLY